MTETPSISIRLPQDMVDFIDNEIHEGKYPSRSDYFYRLVFLNMIQNKILNIASVIIDEALNKKMYTQEHEEFIRKIIEEYIPPK